MNVGYFLSVLGSIFSGSLMFGHDRDSLELHQNVYSTYAVPQTLNKQLLQPF